MSPFLYKVITPCLYPIPGDHSLLLSSAYMGFEYGEYEPVNSFTEAKYEELVGNNPEMLFDRAVEFTVSSNRLYTSKVPSSVISDTLSKHSETWLRDWDDVMRRYQLLTPMSGFVRETSAAETTSSLYEEIKRKARNASYDVDDVRVDNDFSLLSLFSYPWYSHRRVAARSPEEDVFCFQPVHEEMMTDVIKEFVKRLPEYQKTVISFAKRMYEAALVVRFMPLCSATLSVLSDDFRAAGKRMIEKISSLDFVGCQNISLSLNKEAVIAKYGDEYALRHYNRYKRFRNDYDVDGDTTTSEEDTTTVTEKKTISLLATTS